MHVTRTTRVLTALTAILAIPACAVYTGTGSASPPPNTQLHSTGSGGATTTQVNAGGDATPQNGTMDGLTMRQREYAEQQNNSFQQYIDGFNSSCDAQIDAKIDWRTFREQIDRQLDGDLHVSFASYCGEALGAMDGICRDNEGSKAAIRERILSFTCLYTDGQRTIGLEGTHLQMTIDWEAPNYDAYVSDYIGRTL